MYKKKLNKRKYNSKNKLIKHKVTITKKANKNITGAFLNFNKKTSKNKKINKKKQNKDKQKQNKSRSHKKHIKISGRPKKVLTKKQIIAKRSKNYKRPKHYKTLEQIKNKIFILKEKKTGFIIERIRTNKNQVFFLKYKTLKRRTKIINKLEAAGGKSGISKFQYFKTESVRHKDYADFNYTEAKFKKVLIQRGFK